MAAPRMERYTERDFMDGNPVELLQATGDPTVYIEWPHPRERKLGPRVGYAIYEQYPELLEHVDYECGNPKGVRELVESGAFDDVSGHRHSAGGSDLNRSYDPSIVPETYEHYRALEILQKIQERDYDYVLDLHTSTTDVGRCLIISEDFFDTEPIRDIIRASPIERIIVFPQQIAIAGLIGNVPQSVSMEYSEDVALNVGVEETITTLKGLATGEPQYTGMKREVYTNIVHIPKTEDPGPDARNFVRTPEGYIPFLYGDNSYRTDPTKPYLGFAALRMTEMAI